MGSGNRFIGMAVCLFSLFCGSLMGDNAGYFGAGKGTLESPYWVENAEQLQNVRLFPNACFIQVKDIDVGETEFKPIGTFKAPFTGIYDGDGHRISIDNLVSTEGPVKLVAPWGFASKGIIKNLIMDVRVSVELEGRLCLGGVLACSSGAEVSRCSLTSYSNLKAISEKCLYAGGIVGYSAFGGVVRSCSFDGKIEGRTRGNVEAVCAVGGIVGENRTGASISKSTFSENASVSAYSSDSPAWVGGIAGFNEDFTYVCDCHAVVPQDLKPDYTKVKRINTEISKCNSAGNISGYGNERIAVGGIVGFNVGKVYSCLTQASANAKGAILKFNDLPSALIGGIVGDNTGVVCNSSSLYAIQVLSDGFLGVGGVVGRNSGIVDRCNYFSVSGICSSSFTALRNFSLFSALTSVSARGGIVGVNNRSGKGGTLVNCKVFGASGEEQLISSYGHSRSHYGTLIGLDYF